MASDETRRLLKLFGVAVTNLEEAIDGKAPVEKVAELDEELATRWREVESYLERLRSRRIA
ncbi:MAG TPA: hypothetical protein VLF19_12645 [Methylomirabilota bacterium]|nr:hypothetical protein [Methylomirabilota bacterium]